MSFHSFEIGSVGGRRGRGSPEFFSQIGPWSSGLTVVSEPQRESSHSFFVASFAGPSSVSKSSGFDEHFSDASKLVTFTWKRNIMFLDCKDNFVVQRKFKCMWIYADCCTFHNAMSQIQVEFTSVSFPLLILPSGPRFSPASSRVTLSGIGSPQFKGRTTRPAWQNSLKEEIMLIFLLLLFQRCLWLVKYLLLHIKRYR